jgi:hypothetical protein
MKDASKPVVDDATQLTQDAINAVKGVMKR